MEIPRAMLREYQRMQGSSKHLPDPEEFWKRSGLCKRLRIYEQRDVDHENLWDVLDWLDETNLEAKYRKANSQERIELVITEIPEEYPNAKEIWALLDSKV